MTMNPSALPRCEFSARRALAAALALAVLGASGTAVTPVAAAHADFTPAAEPAAAPAADPATDAAGAPVPAFTYARVDTTTGDSAEGDSAGDGTLTVAWESTAASVRVLATADPAGVDGLTEIGSGPGTGSVQVPDPVAGAQRARIVLEADTGDRVLLADRSLHLNHARNLRDFAGYRTTDGRWVRPGVAFRSNNLSGTDDADWAVLAGEGVNTVVDLRYTQEITKSPDYLPAGVDYRRADVVALDSGQVPDLSRCAAPATGANLVAAAQAAPEIDDVGTGMGYPVTVCYGAASTALASLMRTIADDGRTVVFHCSAGKDRTGWASAVLLSILGVDRQTIMANYLDSNVYYRDNAVYAGWLDASFAQADALYGGMDGYVRDGLGLTDAEVQAIRGRMLEPVGA